LSVGKKPPDILIGVAPKETRVAVAEDGNPIEYRIEREGARSEIGDVHLGRIAKVVPALDAAFVDIGGPKPGFLPTDGKPPNEGDAVVVEVVRDAEAGKGPKLALHSREWETTGMRPPRRLHHEPALMARTLRDWQGPVGRILVDDMAAFGKLREFCREFRPDFLPHLAHTREGSALETDGVADRLAELLDDWVKLPSGGRINVAETAALTAIDVDTGSDSSSRSLEETALRVNAEAAAEIARQLRLRDLKGLIVVGFVPMRAAAHRERVLAALKRACAADPAGVAVGGFTRFGLVELIRRRTRGPSPA
jgi:Ribonuclease G/E